MVGERLAAHLFAVLFIMACFPAGNVRAQEVDCAPEALEQRVGACGLDLNCINEVMAEYNEACMGGQSGMPGMGTGGMGGMGGMGGEMMQRIQACGADQECARRVMAEMQEQADRDAPDTTARLHERTILSPAWLQSYQEALVACEKNVGCWMTMMGASIRRVEARCGTNFMIEATGICHAAARYEVHIEQAIAQQRLWQKGIRFEENAPGAQPPAEPGPGATPETPGTDPVPMLEDGGLGFLPPVPQNDVEALLASWEETLAARLPADARGRITQGAAAYPVDADPELPPLVYEEEEESAGLVLDARPTRRDWYFALTAITLTDLGLREGGENGTRLLDAALWSLLQAAHLHDEVEHYSNIGFHLNVRGETQAARTVLAYARSLDPSHPDPHNNLAFSYAAMGQADEALALQEQAARLAPGDAHIESRLQAMRQRAGQDPMPYGGDFGEAFFRLGKRHVLREWEAGHKWFKAREYARHAAFGGTPVVAGPASWYSEALKDIAADYSACVANAPEVLKGCPFGAGIIHPSCANAATPQQVERSQHNRNVHLCQCSANDIMARADALSAWLDRALQLWQEHERAWWPRLLAYGEAWRPDIEAVNQRYQGTNFKFPVESGYSYWPQEFKEDSQEAWGEDLPDIAERWHDLKTRVQKLKSCGTRLPPIPDKPKKVEPPKKPKVKEYGFNLFVVEFKFSFDGHFKVGADLGFVKGSYERQAGGTGHKFTVGSGPVEFAYETNPAPRPGGDSSRFSMTVGTNFFKFVPGAGGAAAKIADQFVSFGAKYELTWGNKSGFTGKASVEAKSKVGYSSRDVNMAPATRMLN